MSHIKHVITYTSVAYAKCHLRRVSFTPSVIYSECHLCRVSRVSLNAECRYAECRGAF
jgi:hypothetical protein